MQICKGHFTAPYIIRIRAIWRRSCRRICWEQCHPHWLNEMLGFEMKHISCSAALVNGNEWLNRCHTADNTSQYLLCLPVSYTTKSLPVKSARSIADSQMGMVYFSMSAS